MRPTKLEVMRANRRALERTRRFAVTRREAIELAMDEDSELVEVQAALAEINEAKVTPRPPVRWWRHLLAFNPLRRSPS